MESGVAATRDPHNCLPLVDNYLVANGITTFGLHFNAALAHRVVRRGAIGPFGKYRFSRGTTDSRFFLHIGRTTRCFLIGSIFLLSRTF